MFRTLLAALAVGLGPADAAASDVAGRARGLLEQSVAFQTVEGRGRVPAYAGFLAQTLVAGGFSEADITIEPLGETATLTARYRGRRAGPGIVLSGHMDVVDARAADWGRDPFVVTEANGFLYGRGVADNKFDIAVMVAVLLQLKSEGFVPERDIVLALSGDEETDMASSRRLADQLRHSAVVLNGDTGGGVLGSDNTPVAFNLQVAEKSYVDFDVVFRNPGGHSARPRADNALVDMAEAIQRVARHRFPVRSTPSTRAAFAAVSNNTPRDLGEAMLRFSQDPLDERAIERISSAPEYVGQIRTTCVPTMASAGHAVNALAQRASFTVNCRIFPGETVEQTLQTLTEIIALPGASLSVRGEPLTSPAQVVEDEIVQAVQAAVSARGFDQEVAVVPQMSVGASDNTHYRNRGVPAYGVQSLFIRAEDRFAHGLNERVPVDAFDGAVRQWRALLETLASH